MCTSFELKRWSTKETLSSNSNLFHLWCFLGDCIFFIITLLGHVEMKLFGSADCLFFGIGDMPISSRCFCKVEMWLVVEWRFLLLHIFKNLSLYRNFLSNFGLLQVWFDKTIRLLEISFLQTLETWYRVLALTLGKQASSKLVRKWCTIQTTSPFSLVKSFWWIYFGIKIKWCFYSLRWIHPRSSGAQWLWKIIISIVQSNWTNNKRFLKRYSIHCLSSFVLK